jgi:hypothetical protein
MISRRPIAHGLPSLCVIVVLLCSRDARAGLVIDPRLAETGDKQFVMTPADVGRRIPINVYAVVTGSDPTATEGFNFAVGSFISERDANGGVLGQIDPAGDLDTTTFETVLPAISPYNNISAQRGASRDIPLPGASSGDGVIDLGDDVRRGNDIGQQLVAFNSSTTQVGSGAVIPNGREFHIGRIEFEISEIQGFGETAIHWFFRQNLDGSQSVNAASFRQDGVNFNGSGDTAAGAPVLFVVPELTSFALVALSVVSLATFRRVRNATPHLR